MRSAEFGFLGVMVLTCVQTPRFCGEPLPRVSFPFNELKVKRSAGALVFLTTGLRGLRKEELPSFRAVLRSRGHLLLPVALMIYLLVANYTPLFAGFWAIVSTFAVAWAWEEGRAIFVQRIPLRSRWYVLVPAAAFAAGVLGGLGTEPSAFLFLAVGFVVALFNPGNSPALDALRASLEQGARGAIGVALATAVVGFVVGAASLTSLGLNLGSAIVNYNQYYTGAPERLWATIVMCSIVGLAFVGLVKAAEVRFVSRRYRPSAPL